MIFWPYPYKRYTNIPFPSYRFIPGLNPHPTEEAEGHSYGKKEENIPWYPPEQWFRSQQYFYAIDLYNHAYWWEAHEAWEGLWRQPQATYLTEQFLQGLIKIAAAFLKWELHQQRGVEYLYSEGIEHLKTVLAEREIYMGINLIEFITKLSNHFTIVVADVDRWPDPLENYSFIVLEKEPGRLIEPSVKK